MFSGLLMRGRFCSFGNVTLIDVTTTGIVIRKMISKTNITSTSGVVLISDVTRLPAPAPAPMLIATVTVSGSVRRRGEQGGAHLGAERRDVVQRGRVAPDQPVVAEHRRHRDGQSDGGHDER